MWLKPGVSPHENRVNRRVTTHHHIPRVSNVVEEDTSVDIWPSGLYTENYGNQVRYNLFQT